MIAKGRSTSHRPANRQYEALGIGGPQRAQGAVILNSPTRSAPKRGLLGSLWVLGSGFGDGIDVVEGVWAG